jgi:hypothetical protein
MADHRQAQISPFAYHNGDKLLEHLTEATKNASSVVVLLKEKEGTLHFQK